LPQKPQDKPLPARTATHYYQKQSSGDAISYRCAPTKTKHNARGIACLRPGIQTGLALPAYQDLINNWVGQGNFHAADNYQRNADFGGAF
jgi:hypothetical protein